MNARLCTGDTRVRHVELASLRPHALSDDVAGREDRGDCLLVETPSGIGQDPILEGQEGLYAPRSAWRSDAEKAKASRRLCVCCALAERTMACPPQRAPTFLSAGCSKGAWGQLQCFGVNTRMQTSLPDQWSENLLCLSCTAEGAVSGRKLNSLCKTRTNTCTYFPSMANLPPGTRVLHCPRQPRRTTTQLQGLLTSGSSSLLGHRNCNKDRNYNMKHICWTWLLCNAAPGTWGLRHRAGVGWPVGTSGSPHSVVFCGGVPPGLCVVVVEFECAVGGCVCWAWIAFFWGGIPLLAIAASLPAWCCLPCRR